MKDFAAIDFERAKGGKVAATVVIYLCPKLCDSFLQGEGRAFSFRSCIAYVYCHETVPYL